MTVIMASLLGFCLGVIASILFLIIIACMSIKSDNKKQEEIYKKTNDILKEIDKK